MKRKTYNELQIVKILNEAEARVPVAELSRQYGFSQNGYVERFNRTFREDVLDAFSSSSIQEASDIAEEWLEEYNAIRPHEALGGLAPLSICDPTSLIFPLATGTKNGMLTSLVDIIQGG